MTDRLLTDALADVLRPIVAELVAEQVHRQGLHELERHDDDPPFLTVAQYAERHQTTPAAVRARIRRGALEAATIRLHFQLAVDDRTRVPLKTDAGERELPVLPALRRRLIAHRLASPWTRPGDPVFAATSGRPKAHRNVRRALEMIGDELGIDLCSHDFRRLLASFLIVAARADEAAVTAVMGHANIETTRRIYAGDWREAEERNAIVLRQLAEAGIGQ